MMLQEPGAAEKSIRDLPPSAIGDSANFDALGLVERSKGEVLKAIVDSVRDGSTLRVYLLPDYQFVQVYCAGIQVRNGPEPSFVWDCFEYEC